MDQSPGRAGSPGPLQAMTADRVNQRDSIFSHLRSESPGSVHDKISQFNSLSLTMQSKQLERKTADAALKRAMLGREEAEAEMRRYKEEARVLRKAVEESKERERKVGERLETLMENYGRAKETHAHTQALWEKEIRRARKETFKTQSSIVKLQEELKSARSTAKLNDESLHREKERSKVREQEAFSARYQIVGVQEQLEQALERIKVVEQERDAFKTALQNEEVARIAAEGRLPLPKSTSTDDEFASPKKKGSKFTFREPRVSLSTMDIVSSASSEAEIEELTLQVQWERQRADRAQEMIEFLQAECQLRCCPCSKSKHRASLGSSRQKRRSSIGLEGPTEKLPKLDESAPEEVPEEVPEVPAEAAPEEEEVVETEEPQVEAQEESVTEAEMTEPQLELHFEPQVESEVEPEPTKLAAPKSKKEPRRSTIFCPREGIFRTVSEQEAMAIEAQEKLEAEEKAQAEQEMPQETHEEAREEVQESTVEASIEVGDETEVPAEPTIEVDGETEIPSPVEERNPRMFARTPSVDPPAFALLAQERTSLLSLLNAPHSDAHTAPLPAIPTMPAASPAASADSAPEPRPHTSAAFYTVTTTTTVPIHDDAAIAHDSSFAEKLRTPSHNATFDLTNPALTPTMTREEALAKIRERRGRARSMAQGTATPRKKMVEGLSRRDMSAPTGKVAGSGKAR